MAVAERTTRLTSNELPSPKGTKLLLVVPDGVGVRNFLHGRFLNVWQQLAGVESLETCSGLPVGPLREVVGNSLAETRMHEMPIYRETPATGFVRKSLEVAHLARFRTAGMRYVLDMGKPRGRSRRAMLNRLAYFTGQLLSKPKGIARLNRLHLRRVMMNGLTDHYRSLLRSIRPSVVFFTHQRPPQIFPLAAAARSLGIPTACFIFSWDNLSSKGRMPVLFNHYLVWSDRMRDELLRFYPDVHMRQVHVVGTPQFEPYDYEDFGWTEARFCEETGASLGRRRICFSAGDATTSPNDPQYIEALAQANRERAFGEGVELIVRSSPAEEGDRFVAVIANHPEVIWSPPRWVQTRSGHPEPWSQRVPQAGDIDLLKSLTRYCDVNVNMASTMTLDFSFAGKPVVNVASGNGQYGAPWSDLFFYDYDHYRPVLELGAARLALNPAELVLAVNRYLDDPTLDSEGRAALLEMQVSVPLHGTSERIARTLATVAETVIAGLGGKLK
ncbi:MAG: hypothetical protein WCD37_10635 [Chloroflexia bacterium]